VASGYGSLNSKTVAAAIHLFTVDPPCELTSTNLSALLLRYRLRHLEAQ